MFSLKRQQNLLEKFKLNLLRNIIEKKIQALKLKDSSLFDCSSIELN